MKKLIFKYFNRINKFDTKLLKTLQLEAIFLDITNIATI